MKKIKSEKGGITVFVIVAILFIMAILIGVFWKSTNYQVTVLQAERQIKDTYGKDTKNVDQIYQNLSNERENYLTVTAGVRVTGGNGRYNGAIIPEGFTLSKIPGEYENVDDGIVIYDIPADVDTNAEGFWTETVTIDGITCPKVQTEYNQFVWVPVQTAYVTAEEITEMINSSDTKYLSITDNQTAINYLINNENRYPMAVKLSDGNYRGILYDFVEGTNGVNVTSREFSINPNESYDYNVSGYKTYYREPGMVSYDYGIDADGNALNPTPNTIGLTRIRLQAEYNSMVKSVSKYKGYYVARYELGYNTTTNKGESKRAQTVTSSNNANTSMWYGLYSACQGMYNTNSDKVKSMMISGSQYDQVMIWMKNVKNITDNSKYYILDSTGMGIYKIGTTNGTVSKSGSNDSYKVNQIYDLGGNLWEWISETYSKDGRATRGGVYNYESLNFSASGRSAVNSNKTSNVSSSRSTFYIKIPTTTIASTNILNPGERAKGGNKKYLGIIVPEGFTVSGIKGEYESVDNGIVIYDIPANVDTSVEGFWTKTTTIDGITCPEVQTLYNQFVWVPVKTAYVNASQISDMIASTEDRYSGVTNNQTAIDYLIENENKYPMAVKMSDGNYRGILYNFAAGESGVNITTREFSINPNESYDYNVSGSKTYFREPGMVSYDYGFDKDGNTVSPSPNTIDLTQAKLQTEYNAMVESIAKYKGFFIARYELSYNTKGESKRTKTVATAKSTNTKTWYGLYTACQGIYNSSLDKIQSMMICGSQYDQVMIWMKDVKNITDNSKYYILDSSDMGIYKEGETNGTVASTGSNDNYKVKQIYDIAGNLDEWTSETTYQNARVLRGGDYAYLGSEWTVSRRNGYHIPSQANQYTTHPALYIK